MFNYIHYFLCLKEMMLLFLQLMTELGDANSKPMLTH